MGRAMAARHEDAAGMVIGEVFTRLNAGALVPAMRAAIADFRPDLVLRDPAEFASARCAAEADIRQIRIGHGLSSGEETLLRHARLILEQWSPGLTDLVADSAYFTRFPSCVDPPTFRGDAAVSGGSGPRASTNPSRCGTSVRLRHPRHGGSDDRAPSSVVRRPTRGPRWSPRLRAVDHRTRPRAGQRGVSASQRRSHTLGESTGGHGARCCHRQPWWFWDGAGRAGGRVSPTRGASIRRPRRERGHGRAGRTWTSRYRPSQRRPRSHEETGPRRRAQDPPLAAAGPRRRPDALAKP